MKNYFLHTLIIGCAVMGTYHLIMAFSSPQIRLLIRGRYRLLRGQCPACKEGWSDPRKHCGICGDYDRKPDAVRKQCWLLAYKLHLGVLKLTKPTSKEKY